MPAVSNAWLMQPMKSIGLRRKCAKMLFAKTEGLVKKGNAYAWMDLVAAHVKKRVGCGTKILMKRVGNQKILVDLLY